MLLEGKSPFEVARFYSISTAIYAAVLTLGIFLSNFYLHAGHSVYYTVFVFIIIVELLKYVNIQLVYSNYVTYKPKQKLKLISTIFQLVQGIKVMELFKCIMALIGCTLIVFVTSVIFGAEFLNKHEETLMFSSLITTLAFFPVCLYQGLGGLMSFVNGTQANDAFTTVLLRNIQFTSMGAWLGAFVIPLDWERDWQVWPIPCSLGALFGFTIGHIFSIFCLLTKKGRKLK